MMYIFFLQRIRWYCMVSTPFIAFYVIGMILQSGWDYLLKLGAFIILYVAVYLMNHFVFDERLFHILPMSIYLATKVGVILSRILDNRERLRTINS